MNEQFREIIRAVSKGDTSVVEPFFNKPGGRSYLENITLILINSLPNDYGQKEELYRGFVAVLDRLEQRILRQQQGQEVLDGVFKKP